MAKPDGELLRRPDASCSVQIGQGDRVPDRPILGLPHTFALPIATHVRFRPQDARLRSEIEDEVD